MAYRIRFAEVTGPQLQALTARQRALIFEAVEKQLMHTPLTETRNRKPLRPNPIAPWELRIGALRVFYEVAADEPDLVRILAVGEKRGSVLRIGGREVSL